MRTDTKWKLNELKTGGGMENLVLNIQSKQKWTAIKFALISRCDITRSSRGLDRNDKTTNVPEN